MKDYRRRFFINMRFSNLDFARLDAACRMEPDRPSRTEMVRRIIVRALSAIAREMQEAA